VLEHVEPKLIVIISPSLYLQNLLVPSVHCDINTPANAVDDKTIRDKAKIILIFLLIIMTPWIYVFIVILLLAKCVIIKK
jgi:hypothetical protein